MGGLPRRSTVLKTLNTAGPTFVVDAGDLYWKSRTGPGADLEQVKEKARFIAEVMSRGGVDAMLPAAGDLALGVAFVGELGSRWKLPYVASNYTCDGKAPFESVREVERGGVRLAVVGVLGDEVDRDGCQHAEPVEALRPILAKVKADVVVVLSDLDDDENVRLSTALPDVDFVVDSNRQQRPNPVLLPSGGLLLGAGSRGKLLPVLDFTLVPGGVRWEDSAARGRLAAQKDRYTRRLEEEKSKLAGATDEATRQKAERQILFLEKMVAQADGELQAASAAQTGAAHRVSNRYEELDARIADDPEVAALLVAAKERMGAVLPEDADTHVRMGPFVGSAACQGCHPAAWTQWQTTGHSHSWDTLTAQKSDTNPSCFACHVTGAHHPDGPRTVAETDVRLREVGCESCHGAGRDHAANPTVSMVRDPGPALCMTCHDGVNDEGRFDFGTYRPKVVHGPK